MKIFSQKNDDDNKKNELSSYKTDILIDSQIIRIQLKSVGYSEFRRVTCNQVSARLFSGYGYRALLWEDSRAQRFYPILWTGTGNAVPVSVPVPNNERNRFHFRFLKILWNRFEKFFINGVWNNWFFRSKFTFFTFRNCSYNILENNFFSKTSQNSEHTKIAVIQYVSIEWPSV